MTISVEQIGTFEYSASIPIIQYRIKVFKKIREFCPGCATGRNGLKLFPFFKSLPSDARNSSFCIFPSEYYKITVRDPAPTVIQHPHTIGVFYIMSSLLKNSQPHEYLTEKFNDSLEESQDSRRGSYCSRSARCGA